MFLTSNLIVFFADELKNLSLSRPHCESFLPGSSGVPAFLCGFKYPGF